MVMMNESELVKNKIAIFSRLAVSYGRHYTFAFCRQKLPYASKGTIGHGYSFHLSPGAAFPTLANKLQTYVGPLRNLH